MARGWWDQILRWGQINLREIDPLGTDPAWWAQYWHDCGVGAVTINAGGIVAYYPTEIEHHRRSPYLGDQDLFGELLHALRGRGIRVLARFSATRQHTGMYYAHPDWFARDAGGNPVTELPVGRDVLYHVCNSGPFHDQWLPSVVDEVLRKYRPDGIFCNVWTGLRGVCYCPRCRRLFRQATGYDLPARLTPGEPHDAASRRYVDWRYRLNNRWVAFMRDRVKAHSAEATFVVNQHSWTGSAANGEDLREIARLTDVIDSDFQGRGLGEGGQPIWGAGENGRVLRAAVGPRPGAAVPAGVTGAYEGWRLVAKTGAEQTVWLAGMAASGIRVWLHFVGAARGGLFDDPRRFAAPQAYLQWHRDNEDCFRDLESLARVAILLSKPTADYYGARRGEVAGPSGQRTGERGGERGMAHVRGFGWTLLRAGLPYDFLHDADLDAPDAPAILSRYAVFVLPNVACLSDRQAQVIRDWVRGGGGLVSTYETGRFSEDLQPRDDSALADVFGAAADGSRVGGDDHWYMRFEDEGAPLHAGDAPFAGGSGDLLATTLVDGAAAGLTFLPPIPTMPPEAPYFTVEQTDLPCAVLHAFGQGRSVYFPFALDALAYRRSHPDHAAILLGALRWAAGGDFESVQADAPGLVDTYAYRHPDGALVVHLVNAGQPGGWRGPIDRLSAAAPVTLTVPAAFLPSSASHAELRRAGDRVTPDRDARRAQIIIPAVRDFEAVRFASKEGN